MHVFTRSRPIITLALIVVLLIVHSPAYAATIWFVAPTGDDQHDCQSPATPCATIQGALAKPGFTSGDSIRIAIGTYIGTGSEVVRLTVDAMLSGGWDIGFVSQGGSSRIDGEGIRRGLTIPAHIAVTIDDLILDHGRDTGGGGGGILNEGGDLTLVNSTVQQSVSTYPAAGAGGGGIMSHRGTLHLRNTTIRDNHADFSGGGLWVLGGSATITNTTILSNTVGNLCCAGSGGGGGIASNDALVTITNSTIAYNRALNGYIGSGINTSGGYPDASIGILTLNNSTISGNSGVRESMYNLSGTIHLKNATISENQGIALINNAGIIVAG
ncbi:MAG: hypothetical protein ABI901_16045, partial [Roseiflexaceae bacterium]